MPLKNIIYLVLILVGKFGMGQNMQILYDFDRLPQTLMLNPGSEVDFYRHMGIPLFSNIYFQFGASNPRVSYNSVLSGTNSFNERLTNLYAEDPSSDDLYVVNQQWEVFNVGWRLKDPSYYLSFGMYQEANAFGKYPEDLMNLFFKGNDQDGDGIPETDDPFGISELTALGELIGVWHVGVNKTVNDRLTLGARLKMYSGALSMQTVSNEGIYSLTQSNAGFEHVFRALNAGVNTSGLINDDGTNAIEGPAELLSGFVFGSGNYGLGIDLGFTLETSNQITLSASVLDLGFVNFSNQVTTYEIKEDFSIRDEPFFPPEGEEIDYWNGLWNEYYDAGLLEKLDTLNASYTQLRPVKLHGSIKKTVERRNRKSPVFRNVWGEDADAYKRKLESAYGLQLYSEFRPTTVLWAVTGFYSREFTDALNAKVTYTVDRYSFYNIGVGLSARINRFNVFIAADNLLALPQVKESNYQSFQLGMNLIFN
jgi:hypothetical protein